MTATPQERPSALPTGTVTFAFTDIEGSTERWERNRAAMEAAMRRHDEVIRSAIAAPGGAVFKTIGDAFCAAFARPEDAVAAMLEAQRAIAAAEFSAIDGLRVRAAIHTGTADERDGDYFGPAVNRVARLLAVGHGGQVLVSGVTADLVQGALPPQASLHDLGEHRLRDLTRPEQVYQLFAPGLPSEFPNLRSLNVLPNNLPRMLTSFIGREKEIADITGLLEKHQLVTLVGSGGVGKTRTSLQVAANLLDGAGDGVWFVELAPLKSGEYIAPAVAQALGLSLASEGEPLENLVRAFKQKKALLVFDNCEHVVEPAARVIATILRGCPKIKIIASSRQGLGLAGEATYRMPSLTVPKTVDSGELKAADCVNYAAVALFAERASAADFGFELTDENAPIIADICRRLDGIPLAIELAAARVKMLSPQQLRARLDERFRVLTGGSRDVLPRQQTMRALIDWSHDLLDQRERALFRRLGIFVDGFALEGAVAVGRGGELDELDVFDLVASLVDKSLVLAERGGDSLRYRFLESTRAYAQEKLRDANELDPIAARHLRHLRERFAELQAHAERTARRTELVDVFAAELEDVRAALDGALTRPDVIEGASLLAEIGGGWKQLGLESEGIVRSEAFLAALPVDESLLLARLSSNLSNMVGVGASLKARALEVATHAVAHAKASGDDPALANALLAYATANSGLNHLDESEKALDKAEAIAGTSAWLRLRLLEARAINSGLKGDYDLAARVYEQQSKDHMALGNTRGERVALLNLAETEHARGRTQRAIALAREVLPGLRRSLDRSSMLNVLCNLAGYLIAEDDLAGADEIAREAINVLSKDEPGHVQVSVAIEHLALVRALGGECARAATLEGYADAAFGRHGFEREKTEMITRDRLNSLLREEFASDELGRLLDSGAALAPEDAIALALEARDS